MASSTIISTRHPDFLTNLEDWDLWRDIWEGGDQFIRRHLTKWSAREKIEDFNKRKLITPVPGFAKAALTDIKNAVFHRMGDIVRRGGSESYIKAIAGLGGGVDRRGAGMNHFIGTQVLPEVLSMGRTGVYVDNISPSGPTLADAQNATPYLYTYRVEDILSWYCSLPEQTSDFQAVLLRDWCVDHNTHAGVQLPSGQFQRFRLVWIDEDGFVNYQFFNEKNVPIDSVGNVGGGPVKLQLKKIPFVMFDIGDSLFRDIANHQIALLNLVSSDVSYALKANFPFYTEQQDTRAMGGHIKNEVMEDGTATSGGQDAAQSEIKVGAIDGRIYDASLDRPGFIHPSSEPLKASMELQRKLEDDIRKLVNLSVVSLGNSRASGEARSFDNQGLESGLSFIGMVLEGGERKISDHWAAYESNTNNNKVVIKYPEQYSLKSQEQRLDEADKLTGLMFSIPSTAAKKELAKDAVTSLMGGRITPDRLEEIHSEIDAANYSTSDPEVVKLAKEEGLVSDITASNQLGYNGEKEVPKANEDHAKRIARIQIAQGVETDPAARGANDLSSDPKSGQTERKEATDTTLQDTTKKNVRGNGKNIN